MTSQPQTIQVFLPKGDPDGIRHAVITTRSVQVWDIPRQLLTEFLEEKHSSRPGVYFLIGPDLHGAPEGYIGQSGNVGKRLMQHSAQKEFWTHALVAVSRHNDWHDAHVGYMEHRAIERAKQSGRYKLKNGNSASNRPTTPSLESDCHEFLNTISLLTAILGAPILEPVKMHNVASTVAAVNSQESTRVGRGPRPFDDTQPNDNQFILTARSCNATGSLTEDGMIVFAGSLGRGILRESSSAWVPKLREKLELQGVIKIDGDDLVFLRDHLFKSSSAASSVLIGGAANGRSNWKNATGRTLGQFEDEKAEASASAKSIGKIKR